MKNEKVKKMASVEGKKERYEIYYTILIRDDLARKIFKEISEIGEVKEGLANLAVIIAKFLNR